jgi:hypothetical protein
MTGKIHTLINPEDAFPVPEIAARKVLYLRDVISLPIELSFRSLNE